MFIISTSSSPRSAARKWLISAPELREGAVGPGTGFQRRLRAVRLRSSPLSSAATPTSTRTLRRKPRPRSLIGSRSNPMPDLFIAGPAFNAGRYGYGLRHHLRRPSRMSWASPCSPVCTRRTPVPTCQGQGPTSSPPQTAPPACVRLPPRWLKLAHEADARARRSALPAEEGYIPNGIRMNFFEKERGSKRAVEMLLKKLADKPFTTEYPMPAFDRVAPNPAVKDLSKASHRAVSPPAASCPRATPIISSPPPLPTTASTDIEGVENLTPDTYETAHGGYDPVYANEDPDRVLPVDVMREFEKRRQDRQAV